MKQRSALFTALGLALAAAFAVCFAWYYDVYIHWQPKVFPFASAALLAAYLALAALTLTARGTRPAGKFALRASIAFAVFCAALFGVSGVLNNVLYHGGNADLAAAVALPLCAAQVLALFILLLRAVEKKAALAAGMAVILSAGALYVAVPAYLRSSYKAPNPVLPEGQFAPMPELGAVDFTVPADGSIEEVRDLIRELRANENDRHCTVLIEDGEYNITHIEFDERDHDTTYRSRDGGVVLGGGMRLEPKDFAPWEKNVNIQVFDLKKLGLGPGDWGELYAYGWASVGKRYDGGEGPLPCELYYNGKRCAIARYPNETHDPEDGFLMTGTVLDGGDASDTRNPRGATFRMDNKTAWRAAGWQADSDIWMFGYFCYDWCDNATRVKAFGDGTVTTEQAAAYEHSQARDYYFFNVLEELDAPGEWYLDRSTGLLYLWPQDDHFDNARIDLTLNTETLIEGVGVKDLTFQGLTLQGTRGDGMRLTGGGITVDHCVIRNLAGNALTLDGCGNTASNNEICFVGMRGIHLSGGDAETLTPGGSRAVNNLIHDWPTVAQTWMYAVELRGVGNLCAHNEIYNSPHTAIYFRGNDNIIEYNNIHDVCRTVSDGGAIYGEQHWEYQGLVIRYNAIYNLGSGKYRPVGIYIDDGRSGVTVRDNLVVNTRIGIQLGGGRDYTVTGNVVVGGDVCVSYDDRSRSGALGSQGNTALGAGSFWYPNEDSGIWRSLWASPWKSEAWRNAYPAVARFSDDPSDMDDPSFIPNPAYSVVTDNVLVGLKPADFAASVQRFSTVEPNAAYSPWRMRNYWALPRYERIPVEIIGRTANLNQGGAS